MSNVAESVGSTLTTAEILNTNADLHAAVEPFALPAAPTAQVNSPTAAVQGTSLPATRGNFVGGFVVDLEKLGTDIDDRLSRAVTTAEKIVVADAVAVKAALTGGVATAETSLKPGEPLVGVSIAPPTSSLFSYLVIFFFVIAAAFVSDYVAFGKVEWLFFLTVALATTREIVRAGH